MRSTPNKRSVMLMTTRIARFVIKNRNMRFINIVPSVNDDDYAALDEGAAAKFNTPQQISSLVTICFY